MIGPNGAPSVVEFNCRLGDPETQVVLPLCDGGLTDCLERVATGHAPSALALPPARFAVTTVLAARGYPDAAEKGAAISIPALPDDVIVFHAGTRLDEAGILRANGGRVLNVTGIAANFEYARTRSRDGAAAIEFDGKIFRRDIGWREAARR